MQRNAINNGFLSIEVPELVNDLKQELGNKQLTVLTGKEVVVDFEKCQVNYNGKVYPISPVGTIAQQLILQGGLENWVINKLKNKQ